MFAYIPARSGSKEFPKNIYKLDGIPLLVHVVPELAKDRFLSEIFVSTDYDEIKSIAEKNNAKCLDLGLKRFQIINLDLSGLLNMIYHAM